MPNEQSVPRWLWNFANVALVVVVAGITVLAIALARGFADPPRASTLWLFDDFKGDVRRWTFMTSANASLQTQAGALVAELTAADASTPEPMVLGLTDGPGADFSLEVAGTPRTGSNDIAYGLVFNWQDETHYCAVLVNGNGYAEAYQQNGDERVEWFDLQQWPHAFSGDNRVRVDVHAGQVTARVNDEWLMDAQIPAGPGKIGVLARGAGTAGGIVFSWVKVWSAP